jgi:hypothetical protein
LNFALDLAAAKLPGVSVVPDALPTPLLPGGLSDATRKTLAEQGADASPARLAGLILGSPEFQKK